MSRTILSVRAFAGMGGRSSSLLSLISEMYVHSRLSDVTLRFISPMTSFSAMRLAN